MALGYIKILPQKGEAEVSRRGRQGTYSAESQLCVHLLLVKFIKHMFVPA